MLFAMGGHDAAVGLKERSNCDVWKCSVVALVYSKWKFGCRFISRLWCKAFRVACLWQWQIGIQQPASATSYKIVTNLTVSRSSVHPHGIFRIAYLCWVHCTYATKLQMFVDFYKGSACYMQMSCLTIKTKMWGYSSRGVI